MSFKNCFKDESGFTLIHLVVILIAFSVAAGVALQSLGGARQEARKAEAIEEIQEIQRAIYGDSRLRDQTEFGFVGDMGRLPTSLAELLTPPADATNWDGPYISSGFLEDGRDPLIDGWGNDYIYDEPTGLVGVSEESLGEDGLVIPSPFDNAEEMLYGGIEGYIVDKYDNPPKKGDRRHILVWMQPIYTEEWPDVTYDNDLDGEIFHMERTWLYKHNVWNVKHFYTEKEDRHKGHWKDKWNWLNLNNMAAFIWREGDIEIDGDKDDDISFNNFNPTMNIVIDKLEIDWERSKSEQRISKIYLGNELVWEGNEKAKSTIDISDFTILAGTNNVPLKLEFNSNLRKKDLELNIYFKDGSRLKIDRSKSDDDERYFGHEEEDDRWDDHKPKYDYWGKEDRFDPHYEKFWEHYLERQQFFEEFLKLKVFLHPDKKGYFGGDEIPIKAYIITAYHDKLEMSVKNYVVVKPNETTRINFRFDALFPGYKEPKVEDEEEDDEDDRRGGRDDEDDEGSGMAELLEVNGRQEIDGSLDTDVTLANSGASDIIIDKIKIDWDKSKHSDKITSIWLGQNAVWSGSEKSDEEINISNVTIPAGGSLLLTLQFNKNLKKQSFSIELKMSDGSEAEFKD